MLSPRLRDLYFFVAQPLYGPNCFLLAVYTHFVGKRKLFPSSLPLPLFLLPRVTDEGSYVG